DRALVAVAGAAFQSLINIDAKLEAVTGHCAGLAHDLDGVVDLPLVLDLKQDAVVDEHARDDASLAQPPRRQPQHFRATALHWEIHQRSLVGAGADVERPAEDRFDLPPQHGALHFLLAPLPEARIHHAMLLDQFAGDERMSIQPSRQRRYAHPVIDAQLQRLHALPHRLLALGPVDSIGVGGEAAVTGKRVVDIATAIGLHQRSIFGTTGSDANATALAL